MTDAPWFPQYAKDWLMETVELSYEQKGAHIDLLCISWARDLPIDPEAVRCLLARCTRAAWARIWPALESRWPVRDGRRVNDWLEGQRSKTLTFRKAMSDAGRKGGLRSGEARLKPGLSQAEARVDHTHSQSQSHPQSHNSSLTLAVVARAPAAGELTFSPGQLQAAAPGLVGAWNNLVAIRSEFAEKFVEVRSHPKLTAALQARPSIDWWGDLFQRVVASDFLRRDAKMAPVDLWWVLDHREEIANGRYDNSAAKSTDPNAAAIAAAKALMR